MKKIFLLILLIVLISFASAELFRPVDERYIATGQNDDWYFINVHRVVGDWYLGISKNDRGAIGIGEKQNGNGLEMFGRMWLMPAFKHPGNNQWYVCPIRDMSSIHEVVDLGNGWWFNASDSAVTCYRYDDHSLTGDANLEVQVSLVTDVDARTKIAANVTVNDVTPVDTGFGFLFIPADASKYRYVDIGGTMYDLAGVEGSVPVQKVLNFYNGNQDFIGHMFDWSDMPDFGSYYAEIDTYAGYKGLFVGTYGYGSTDFISIDPLYQVDYSPTPGELLINGSVDISPDSVFQNITDITVGVSDDNDTTRYVVSGGLLQGADGDLMVSYKFNEVSGNIIYDETDNNFDSQITGAYLNVSGDIGSGVYFNSTGYSNVSSSEVYYETDDSMFCIRIKYNDSMAYGKFFEIDNVEQVGLMFGETLSNGRIKFTLKFYSTSTILSPVSPYDDGSWHSFCIYTNASEDETYIYVDNTSVSNGGQGVVENNTMDALWIGGEPGSSEYEGFLDEACFWKAPGLDKQGIINFYEVYGCPFKNESLGSGIKGEWSQTYASQYDWFLRVKKNSSGTGNFHVFAYDDSDNISGMNVSSTFDSTGWFNVNVSSLMDYQTNTLGLNYTSLRFFTDEEHYFSEVRLRKEANDTQSPVIHNCWVDDSTLYNGEKATFYCNVTDDVDVDYVYEVGVGAHWIKNYDIYSYEYTCDAIGTDVVRSMVNVSGVDILGNNVSYNPGLSTTCRRHCDYKGSGIWSVFKNFVCEISSAFTDFMNTISFSGGNTTVISHNVDNFSNVTIASSSTVVVQNGSTFIVGG